MPERTILTERDSMFSGALDLDQLEVALNRYAGEGWRIAAGLSATSSWKSSTTEIVLVLERERAAA